MTIPTVAYFARAWTAPKPSTVGTANDDAYEIRLTAEAGDSDGLLVSIADGATSSVYSHAWARALVAAATPSWPTLDDELLAGALDGLRADYDPTGGNAVPWYVEHKMAREGSRAALLVALVAPKPGGYVVRAMAIGDCCIFVLGRDGSTAAFPWSKADDFDAFPPLVGSHPQPTVAVQRWECDVEIGDVVLACTDAVAKWVVQCLERDARQDALAMLLRLVETTGGCPAEMTHEALSGFFTASAGRPVEEDDLTLVMCAPLPPGTTEPPAAVIRLLREHLGLAGATPAGPDRSTPPPFRAVYRRLLRSWRTERGG